MLKLLPDIKFPVTPAQINPLMESVQQLNIIDAGLSEQYQRALGIFFHVLDLYCKSGGKIDYRGAQGHRRLMEDSAAFVGGTSIVTKHGDLAAAHLALDFSDTQIRLKAIGHDPLPYEVRDLLKLCMDFAHYPPRTEKQVEVLMDYLGKKTV